MIRYEGLAHTRSSLGWAEESDQRNDSYSDSDIDSDLCLSTRGSTYVGDFWVLPMRFEASHRTHTFPARACGYLCGRAADGREAEGEIK